MGVVGVNGNGVRPYDPDQLLMLPPDLREWVPEGHLAHHMSDLVDAVTLRSHGSAIESSTAIPGFAEGTVRNW